MNTIKYLKFLSIENKVQIKIEEEYNRGYIIKNENEIRLQTDK